MGDVYVRNNWSILSPIIVQRKSGFTTKLIRQARVAYVRIIFVPKHPHHPGFYNAPARLRWQDARGHGEVPACGKPTTAFIARPLSLEEALSQKLSAFLRALHAV